MFNLTEILGHVIADRSPRVSAIQREREDIHSDTPSLAKNTLVPFYQGTENIVHIRHIQKQKFVRPKWSLARVKIDYGS